MKEHLFIHACFEGHAHIVNYLVTETPCDVLAVDNKIHIYDLDGRCCGDVTGENMPKHTDLEPLTRSVI